MHIDESINHLEGKTPFRGVKIGNRMVTTGNRPERGKVVDNEASSDNKS
jgi:hypothetical protein